MIQRYKSGRTFEYRIMKYLRKEGFYCMRSYASKGAADIVAVPPKGYRSTLLIQAKHSKTGWLDIRQNEVQELVELQAKSEGTVIIIHNKNRKLYVRWPGGKASIPLGDFLDATKACAVFPSPGPHS